MKRKGENGKMRDTEIEERDWGMQRKRRRKEKKKEEGKKEEKTRERKNER